MKTKKKKIVIVGAGISGLVAGSYLLKGGQQVIILEKSAHCGGLVSSFCKDGFVFDTGPRAIGNAGILQPMLDDLGLILPCIKGEVSTGIKDTVINYDTDSSVHDFIATLRKLFPESIKSIQVIEKKIKRNMHISHILNNMPNPFFKKLFTNLGFFFTGFLPRMPAFLWALAATSTTPIEESLKKVTDNQSLIDMLCQHYFKGTPSTFAFGYFENFYDYLYPLGGTGKLAEVLKERILAKQGQIYTHSEVVSIKPAYKTVRDATGKEWEYDDLIWCADIGSLYKRIDSTGLSIKQTHAIATEKTKYTTTTVGESVFTLFLAVDQPKEYFANISKGHFIYTPQTRGLGQLHRSTLDDIKARFSDISKQELFAWLKDFCHYNSYEISIPVLKDESLAPKNKTGLVVSFLCDGELWRLAKEKGWYEELKAKTTEYMLQELENTIYPDLQKNLLFIDIATPCTLMRMFNTRGGAITGWSLEGAIPVPNDLLHIAKTPYTAIPNVYKAGQWAYSPSGVPVAILTGRIAASKILKDGILF